MKTNQLKKWLSAAFVGTLAFSTLAACAANNGGGGTTTSSQGSTAQGNSTSEEGAFSEQVTLKIPVYDRGVEGVPTVNDNYWTKWVQENFGDPNNIKVEYVPIARQNVMTDYSLLASSQDLPTILMEYDYPKVSQWANEGYLSTFDMDDFKEAAPTYYAQMEEEGQMDFTQMNGETYFTLAKRPYWDSTYNFQQFYRKDWLEQVGYDEYPIEYADYVDAMKKIQEAGLADHPLGGNMIPAQGADMPFPFMGHPVDEKEWATYVSAVLPAMGYEPSKQVLKRENQKYNDGLLNPEYYITNPEEAKAKFINGEAFVMGDYISANMDWLASFYQNNPDAELGIVPAAENDPESGTVANYRADNPFGMIIGFSSQASEDELKAAWMYMEWMSQEDILKEMQWGVEGENYTTNSETGFPETVADYDGEYKQGFSNNKDYWAIVTELRSVGELEDMIKAVSPQGLPQDFTEEIKAVTERTLELGSEGYAVNIPAFSVPLESETEYMGTLTQLYTELRDKLVMAKPEEFDALYEQYTQQYNEAGFKEVVEERQKAYEDGNSTKLLQVE